MVREARVGFIRSPCVGVWRVKYRLYIEIPHRVTA